MTHSHRCPYCYKAFVCKLTCSTEPDLKKGEREYGSQVVCRGIVCLLEAAVERYEYRRQARMREALRRLQTFVES